MSIELLSTLSLISFIVAGILFLITIALFFLLDVPKLIGDISGSTARKAIEAIRQQNESTGNKAYKPSSVNVSRGKLTDRISPSGSLQHSSDSLGIGAQTEKFATTELSAAAAEATSILRGSEETTKLSESEAGVTTLLSEQDFPNVNENNSSNGKAIIVETEMGFTCTSEIIE